MPSKTSSPKPRASKVRSAAAPAPRRRKQQRGQGRPGQDGAVGQESIIRAARALLRECTPQALLLKDVAALAGVDAALIHYYFGNKEELIRATVADMMAESQARSRVLLRNDWPPVKRLRERLSAVMQQQLAEPNFHRLVVDQLFSRHGDEARKAVEAIAVRGLSLEVDLLQQSRGKLRQVDPRFLNVYILGLCEFFTSAQPLVEALFGHPVDQELTDAYIDFAADLLLNGLAARDADGKAVA